MAGFRSSNGYVGFTSQDDQTTDAAPTTFVRLSSEEAMMQTQEVVEIRSLNADRELDAILKTGHSPGGSFETYLRPGNGTELLAYFLGSDTVVAGTGIYTHTIIKANVIPWLSIERQLDSVERFIGCKIDQIVITGNTGQPVLINVNWLGCNSEIQGSAASASYQTDEPFIFHDGAYTLDSGVITTISAFVLTLSNNLKKILTTTFKPNDLLEGEFDVEITFTLKFEPSETLYAKVLFGSSTTLVDTLADGDITIDLNYGTGTALRRIKFEVSALKHLDIEKHLDPVTKAVYLNVRSKAVKSASEIITVTGVNTISTDWASISGSSSTSPSSSASSSNSPSTSPSASLSPSSSESASASPSASLSS